MKYISIPEEVDAIQFKVETLSELVLFSNCTDFNLTMKGDIYQCTMTVNNGQKLLVIADDYVIKDVKEVISCMKPDVFESKYIKKI